MRSLVVAILLIGLNLYTANSLGQEDQKRVGVLDETFGYVIKRDVPYVPVKLDRTVDSLRTLDIYVHQDAEGLVPIILYLHGGGWAFGDKGDVHLKPPFFTRAGFGFVSMNYRLRWDHKVYDQVVDIVTAISWLMVNGKAYGLDPNRIILMGHAAGGHLASLVMTDSSYLRGEGLDGSNIKAVVSIDSTSYDIHRLMKELGSFVERRRHQLIFTSDENVWKAASPISHVAKSKTLKPFALLYNPNRDASLYQAKGFAKALSDSGVEVVMIPGSADAPDQTDELIGAKGNVTTGALMAFIRSQI